MSASVAVPVWWLDGCRHREVKHSMSCGLSHEPGCVPSCPVATSYAAYTHAQLDETQRTVLRLLTERDALSAQLAEAHRTAERLREVNEAARQELAIVTGERDAKQTELALLRVAHEALLQKLHHVRLVLGTPSDVDTAEWARRVAACSDGYRAHRCPRRGPKARAVLRTSIIRGRHTIAGIYRAADALAHEAACVAIAKSVDARKARGR